MCVSFYVFTCFFLNYLFFLVFSFHTDAYMRDISASCTYVCVYVCMYVCKYVIDCLQESDQWKNVEVCMYVCMYLVIFSLCSNSKRNSSRSINFPRTNSIFCLFHFSSFPRYLFCFNHLNNIIYLEIIFIISVPSSNKRITIILKRKKE